MSHDDSVYDGLLTESEGWAFGTSFEDPLAGVDRCLGVIGFRNHTRDVQQGL